MAEQTIADRYQVQRPIGRGGMGTVWLARDQRLGRDVAVKQIGLLPGERAPDLARAMREARSSAALSHPHVVSVYDVVEEGDRIWLVMEYVASRTLWQIVTEDGPLTPEAAVSIGAQVADGLTAAHAAGTIHRDVKPGNILVTADGVAKISDFGIARAHDQGQLTQTGLVIGTPEYLAPELARGEEPTPAADVWALGASLYAAVEGHPPYRYAGNALALLATISSTPPPTASSAGFLAEPITRMLDPDPEGRWSMTDAAHVLHRLQEGDAHDLTRASASAVAAGRGPDDAEDPPSAHRRQPVGGRLLLVGLLALAGLVALGWFLLHAGSSEQPSATSDPPRPGSTRSTAGAGPTSGAPHSSSTSPASPTRTTTDGAGPQVTGGTAQRFVRDYYAALPSNTRSAWSALSPGFRTQIGGYGRYQGFWSTISSVSVGDTRPAGPGAVDVPLTYTTTDGQVDREVRRIYVERTGSGYLIRGDDVVG